LAVSHLRFWGELFCRHCDVGSRRTAAA
jgi:hypothetical protein